VVVRAYRGDDFTQAATTSTLAVERGERQSALCSVG
jgi:hypothetical protein